VNWASGNLKKETEGLLTAAQDQASRTNVMKVKTDKQAMQNEMQNVQGQGRNSRTLRPNE